MEVANTSLLRYGNNECSKKFYSTGPGPEFDRCKNGLEMKRDEVLMKFLLRSYLTFIIAFIMFEMIEEEQIGKASVSQLSCI
jgi:hypothetical protein